MINYTIPFSVVILSKLHFCFYSIHPKQVNIATETQGVTDSEIELKNLTRN